MISLHRSFFFLLLFCFFQQSGASAQQTTYKTEKSVFYEISGNGLRKSSWMFGTMHLLTQRYIDSLPLVMDRFNTCTQVVGEIVLDSNAAPKMLSAALLKEKNLKDILPEQVYQKTNDWLKELSGYDLTLFNTINPMFIQISLLQMIQSTYYSDTSGSMLMDDYYQKRGAKEYKEVIGLERIDDQIQALFSQFSIDRQTELLTEFVSDKNKSIRELGEMTQLYRKQQLDDLEKLMYDETYKENEINVLLYDRNQKWVEQLPTLMMRAPSFIAVGALHLAGERGLVNLLRQKGYTVTPYYF
ncbi:MAG: TraB/GumN family protein [Bacteroidota bacterium]